MKSDFESELEEKEKQQQVTINQLKNDHIQNIEVGLSFLFAQCRMITIELAYFSNVA